MLRKLKESVERAGAVPVLPDYPLILETLTDSNELRNVRFHANPSRLLRTEFSQKEYDLLEFIVDYVAEHFSLNCRMPTGSELPLVGRHRMLPAQCDLLFSVDGIHIDVTPYLRVIDGHLATRSLDVADKVWILDNGENRELSGA